MNLKKLLSIILIVVSVISCNHKITNVKSLKQGYKSILSKKSIVTTIHKGISNSENLSKLYDKNKNTKFLVTAPKNTITIQNENVSIIKSYAITSANDAPGRDPKNWILSGSVNGETWTVLDKKNDQLFKKRRETRNYELKLNNKEYSFYKIEFEQNKKSVYGDTFLQIAEFDLKKITKAPIVKFSSKSTRAKISDTIQFHDISYNGPTSWKWYFENGIPKYSSEPDPKVYFPVPGNHTVKLVVKNKFGKDSVISKRYVKVYDPENPWKGFHYPKVEFTSTDTVSLGYKRAVRIIPDFTKAINEVTLGVCKQLYKNLSEVPDFEKVNFTFNWSNTLAARGGNNTIMDLWFSTKYIQNALKDDTDEAVKYEIYGVLWHELTHGYQFSPKTENDKYRPGYDYFAFLEGEADLVRINAGYHKTRHPDLGFKNYKYLSGYTTTGFFLKWIVDTYDENFIYKFNKSVIEISPWSYKTAFKEILNKDIDILWKEYEAYVNEYDKTKKVIKKKRIDWKNMN
ncbi:PKD domain-containing protein [Tenacibaculum sp. MAR_2009_124]|uniref:basic secretory protein-like protein n=1 Tax=Tenacibaculum sp. MAR_2009_124 TaxID=1250059 RepID=UPI0008983BEC|nr:basic secretory protein-like protein [Tenacibaculum sp. MAR_2009_124]SEB51236.1 PKD domain-containing protein [Tenacibaculum sp. MAR_2009_124]